MKNLIIALSLFSFLISASPALAGGSYRMGLDQQWKQVQTLQKTQDKKFDRLELDAAREIKSLKKTGVSATPIIYSPTKRK